jgi:hypothetical protein
MFQLDYLVFPINTALSCGANAPAGHAMTAEGPQFNAKSEPIDKVPHRPSTHNTNASDTDSVQEQKLRVSFMSSLSPRQSSVHYHLVRAETNFNESDTPRSRSTQQV